MDRLKAILAEKILDISSGSGDEVKAIIDKVQRFRDFANACQTLMIKYPGIEDELIKMVENRDFDTKVASSRVDSIIRIADIESSHANRVITQAIEESEKLNEAEPITKDREDKEALDSIAELNNASVEETLIEPEDVDFEEVEIREEENSDYVPFQYIEEKEEEISDEENWEATDEPSAHENGLEQMDKPFGEEENPFKSEEEIAAEKRKATIRKIVIIVGIVAAVVALIFVVQFVMSYWQTILIVLGVAAVLAIVVYVWFKRTR